MKAIILNQILLVCLFCAFCYWYMSMLPLACFCLASLLALIMITVVDMFYPGFATDNGGSETFFQIALFACLVYYFIRFLTNEVF